MYSVTISNIKFAVKQVNSAINNTVELKQTLKEVELLLISNYDKIKLCYQMFRPNDQEQIAIFYNGLCRRRYIR